MNGVVGHAKTYRHPVEVLLRYRLPIYHLRRMSMKNSQDGKEAKILINPNQEPRTDRGTRSVTRISPRVKIPPPPIP